MRSFLSSIPIGCLLRPSTRTLVQSAASSHRVAWASTSAQPAEAFPTETVPESSQVGEESAEELRRKAIKLYKEVSERYNPRVGVVHVLIRIATSARS